MAVSSEKNPIGNLADHGLRVQTSVDLGQLIRDQRKRLDLRQTDIAGLGNTGNRFIVDLEKGKPTVQLQKTLDIMDLLGLEVIVRPKKMRGLR